MNLIWASDRRLLFTATVPLIFRCAQHILQDDTERVLKEKSHYNNFAFTPAAVITHFVYKRKCSKILQPSVAEIILLSQVFAIYSTPLTI